MLDKIKTIFTIPDLKRRILFTVALLVIVRMGAHIPVPGVDGAALAQAFQNLQNSLFG